MHFEPTLLSSTHLIAGVDEAGRGPLAGPVVVAAVILDDARPIIGLDDSKKLSEKKREALFEQIIRNAFVSVAFASAASIDRLNIRQATLDAMRRAVMALPFAPESVLVDGRDRIDVPFACEAIVGGDALEPVISAASIVAKVMRDRLMMRMDTLYPAYGFAQHKGYGTADHLAALRAHGPCALHRASFKVR
jgi:ribonuclease HII